MDPKNVQHLFHFFVRAEALRDYERGKRVEVRLWSGKFDRIKKDHNVAIACPTKETVIVRRVVRKTRYDGLQALMDGEKLSDIFPGVMDERSFRSRVGIYYPLEAVEKKLILAFELTTVF